MKVSKYKLEDNTYQCECGKNFGNNYQSLNAHFSHCKIHKEINNVPFKRKSYKGHMCGWENKSQEEINEIHKRSDKTLRDRYINGELIGSFKGKHHSQKTKEILSKKCTKSFVYKLGVRPNFNKKQIDYINQLNIDKGWNLQHAMNGGEKFILHYFVDGYDEKNNIVFEYDEKKHYIDVENNILRDKDIKRQNDIISYLHCDFYRYNEKMKLFYKVS